MWIVQKIKRESLVIQLPDSSLTELNNYNFYSMKEGFFMFGKKKKVKHAERHVDYKVSSENLAMPELHIGEDKGEEQPEKKDIVSLSKFKFLQDECILALAKKYPDFYFELLPDIEFTGLERV